MAIVQKAISIPEPVNQVDSLWRTTQALKEAVEMIQGIRGNREYALLCDLEDATTIINNIVGGGIPGITTLVALSDTDLSGQAQYDLLYNADGANWEDTAGLLQWNGSYLQLANANAINWLDGVGTSVEMLAWVDVAAVGDPCIDDNIILAKFNGTDGSTTYTELALNATTDFYGDAEQDTAVSAANGASVLFDGTDDYIAWGPDNANYLVTASDEYTAEVFFQLVSLPANGDYYTLAAHTSQDWSQWWFALYNDNGTYQIHVKRGFGTTVTQTITTPSTGVMYHAAIQIRQLTTARQDVLFNGDHYYPGQAGGNPSAGGAISEQLTVGGWLNVPADVRDVMDGNIDSFRFTKCARYLDGNATYTIPDPDYFETGSPASEAFTVGDPGYVTNIEGSEVQINGVLLESNVTHTGEVTGATVLAVDVTAITNRTDVVADAADDAMIHDDTDGTIKKVNLSSITDGGYF
jgi:hypothetical protein